MNRSPQTAAVIGTGFIGPVHVEALRRAEIAVSGILGSSPEKSRAAADRLALARGYASLDELLADDQVDVVHVTSPNRFHHEQAMRSLQAGKHVLCEKPLAMSLSEADELVKLAESTGLAAGVNYNIRYYPLCTEAAERVRDGTLGRIFHVTGGYVQDWLFHPTDFNWRVLKDEGGPLRAVADIGTHWLDLIQFIVGDRIEAVLADLTTVYPQRTRPIGGAETFSGRGAKAVDTETVDVDTEDFGAVMLRFSAGGRGVMWVSQVTAGRKNCLRFEIAGSRQSLTWNSESPNEMRVGHRDTANEALLRDPALLTARAAAVASYPGGHNEGFPDTFKHLFIDFYRSIESGSYRRAATFPTFQEGRHELAVCEAILRSHQLQQWVAVET